MSALAAFDVHRMTPGGSVVTHHAGRMETDGPWLILYGTDGVPDLVAPAHVIVAVTRCADRCEATDA